MKLPARILRFAVVACALAAHLHAFALQKGEVAPDFQLTGTAGPVRLADLKGKVVYLDFWASWCCSCLLSFPRMNELQAKYSGKGLRIVAVNVDRKAADANRFLERVPASFPLAFDAAGEVPRLYSVKAMPTSFLIGADGRILEMHAGFADDEKAAREAGIRKALNLP